MSHIARSTLTIAVFFALEKALGFLRQILTARQFGLSAELDAFNSANNLPDMIFALISGGALAIAFIPVLSETLQKQGRPQLWELFSRITNLVFLVTAGLSLAVALFATPLVARVVTPGFSVEQQNLVASLMRVNLLATMIFSLAGLVIAGLQANQHFLLPAMAPSMYDIGMLIGVLVLAPSEPYQFGPLQLPALGMGVYGLVYGTVIGALLFLGIQIPGLLRYRFRYTAAIGLRHPGVQQVLSLLGPRILTMLFIQLIFITTDNLASRLVVGSVAALTYGWLFMQVPETLIGSALGTAMLPTLSEQTARQDEGAFRTALHSSARLLLALSLPVAAVLMTGIRPLVGILGFEAEGTEMVVWTTRAFLLGLAGHVMLEVAVRAFYARQNARLPLIAAGLTFAVFALLAVLLVRPLDVTGIALANSLAFSAEALLLWLLLARRFPGILNVGRTLLRAALAGLLGAAVVYGLLHVPLPLPGLIQAVLAMGVGGLVALPFIWSEIKLLVKL
jgi:putative peptidoglycan lipid II flippase